MKARHLITIQDYLTEYDRVTEQIEKAQSRRAKRNLRVYRKRLYKEIQTFDRYKGTCFAKALPI